MQLNFIAKHRAGESLSCLLIRQSEGLYLSPGELIGRLGSKCNPTTELLALMRDNKSALRNIWQPDALQPSKTFQRLSGGRQFKQWINYNNLGVCSRCAEEGFIPESHDFSMMPACTKHSLTLARHCSACARPYTVNRYHLTHCRCGEPIRSTRADSSELGEAEYLELLLDSGDFETLLAYQALRSIVSRYPTPKLEIESLIEYIAGKPQQLAKAISTAALELPNVSLRALAAPFACSNSEIVKLYAPRLLSFLQKPQQASAVSSGTVDFQLSHQELRYALGLKPQTSALIEHQFFKLVSRRGRPSGSIDYQNLSRFFEPVLAQKSSETVSSVTLAQLSISQKTPLSELIGKVLTGAMTFHSYDEKLPFSQIKVVQDANSSDGSPEGYMTLAAVVAHLDSYEEAVRGVRDAGLLRATHQKSHNNRYLFLETDVEAFHQKYVLIGELARETQSQPMRLSDRLKELGIVPVAGPSEGNSPVSVFKRANINDVDLKGALKLERYATNSGRKPKGHSDFDDKTWATGHEVASELNVPLGQLHRITRHDLLVKGIPPIRGSRRRYYYRRDSLEKTRKFLDDSVELDTFAQQLKTSRKKLLSRYFYLLKAEPIQVGDRAIIPRKHADVVRKHYKNYLDASAAADYLSTTRHQIGNWKKTAKITPISPDNENFIHSPQLYHIDDVEKLRATLQASNKSNGDGEAS